jgi:predicted dehydrogenase
MNEIALVGCGKWGSNILRDLQLLGCRVIVSDIDPHARAQASAKGAFATCSCLDQLPECDGYVVAVPIPQLTEVCACLVPLGKPIFSEKTLCLSVADFQRLERLGGLENIFVMHKWHYHPGIEALRNIAQSGRIGTIEALHANRLTWVDDFHGGDVFWTQSVHDLTIVRHILGYIPPEVRAISVIREGRLPVSFTAMLGNAPSVFLNVSGRHCSRISGVSIHSQYGSAQLYNAYDDHITIRDSAGEEAVSIDTTFPLYLELKEFVAYLNGGVRPRCDLYHGKEVTEAILTLRKAADLPID